MKKNFNTPPLFLTEERFGRLWKLLSKHPFIICAAVCLVTLGFGYQDSFLLYGYTQVIGAAVLTFCTYRLIRRLMDRRRSKLLSAFIFVTEVMAVVLFTGLYLTHDNRAELVYLGFTAAIAAAVIFFTADMLKYRKPCFERLAVLYIFAQGIAMRLGYILESPITRRQNDVHKFGGKDGHSAYIEYIYEHLSLPDFDPTTKWQFYHPPFHHTICAIWLRFQRLIGIPYEIACESIQAISLFCSLACLVLFYKLLRHFRLSGISLILPLSLVAFHPSLIILSGSINNDIMSIMFCIASVYCTAEWYRNPTCKNIIKIALCIGFGMMTKLSVGLVAPAVAGIFLLLLIRKRREWKRIIPQFCAFGAICLPLGLWWSIRNLVKFSVPITYVPSLEPTSWQYIGNIPTKTRLFDFSLYQFKDVFEQWSDKTYLEFNPTVAFLKNSLFGEHMTKYTFEEGALLNYPTILFWTAAVIAVTSFIATAVLSFKKGDRPIKLMLFFYELVLLFSYYKFCFEYPYICTMNFRYIVPCLFVGSLFTGLLCERLSKRSGAAAAICRAAIGGLAVLFFVFTYLTYFVLISSLS